MRSVDTSPICVCLIIVGQTTIGAWFGGHPRPSRPGWRDSAHRGSAFDPKKKPTNRVVFNSLDRAYIN